MRASKVSLRRRQLMIAGFAGTAAPALAGQFDAGGAALETIGAVEAGQGLVISGRLVARNGKPVAGAGVELWVPTARGVAGRTTTDGDGRFFVQIAGDRRGRPQRIGYRVSAAGLTLAKDELHFARGRAVADRRSGQLQRDASGTWRAAFGISIA